MEIFVQYFYIEIFVPLCGDWLGLCLLVYVCLEVSVNARGVQYFVSECADLCTCDY